MELTAAEAWARILERARTLLPEQTFRMWLEQTEPVALSSDVLVVAAWSGFAAEWIGDKYGDFLADLAERLFGRRFQISFEHRETIRRDSTELTAPARTAFLQRFLDAIPADLPLAERHRRALLARKAYFARLALASAQARAKQARRRARGGAA